MAGGCSSNPSISDMTYNPPLLPDFLSRIHNLRAIVGVPTLEEVQAIHDTIRAVNSVSSFPGLYDHTLYTQLAQYLFTVQMAVYRSEYPSSITPMKNTYTPPAFPSHIPISLKQVVGAPSDEELESVHSAVRAMENMANSPFFDAGMSARLSQHLFNIQFACYIQDSDQGSFTRMQGSPPTQHHTNETSIGATKLPLDMADPKPPQYTGPIDSSSIGPIASQGSPPGNPASEPARILQPNEVCATHTGPQCKEIHEQLKVISRIMLVTCNFTHRWDGSGNAKSYRMINDKGELPWMRHLPAISTSNGASLSPFVTEQCLVDYLGFYDVGKELIGAGTGNLKPGKEGDARKLLAHYLYYGYPPMS
ncbi:hypothetical protein ACGC1H_000198 [Rhizoctonia solani]|uniref:Uncharacterized protein n=1 Tax=Rhizoctonia solani TaxID=456999 RepID=A0A8H3GGV0_9AGAM|nr:unnamed protein product [Rhizoctonia solani]